MEIVGIKKNGLFYNVKFDNGDTYKFHESLIIKYGFIRKKIKVDKQKLENAIKDNEYFLALDKGVKYVSSLKSKYDTYIYLKKYYDDDICKNVVSKLLDLKLINDLEYAKAFVHSSIRKYYGPDKIYNDLKNKKINESYIEIALEDYEEEQILNNCVKNLEKYLPSLKKSSKKLGMKKLQNYLLEKGFSNKVITNAIEKSQSLLDNINDDDEILELHYLKLLKSKKSMDDKEFKVKAIRSLTAKGFSLSKVLKIVERRN